MLKFNNITPSKIYYQGNLIKAVKGCDGSNVWEFQEPTHDYEQDYFTMVALENGAFSYAKYGPEQQGISYSLDDGQTWTTSTASTTVLQVSAGDKVLWKGNLNQSITYGRGIGQFSGSTRFNVEGNVMSILYGDNFTGQTTVADYCFRSLFTLSTGLTNSHNLILPATTVGDMAYASIFYGCTALQTAPELPATNIGPFAYYRMFANCPSLVTAPELNARIALPRGAYNGMFSGCTSLNSITCLATDISAEDCTANWVSGVSSTGTFTKAASMNDWSSGNDGVPTNWTVQDYNN